MGKAGKFIGTVAKGLKKEWPKIATALGAGLLVTGGFLLGKEVPLYKKALKEREEQTGEKVKGKEKAKLIAKHFVAPACSITGGALFIVASVCESERRIALGTTAAAISEMSTKNFADYVAAAKEVAGEEGEREIQKKADEKKLESAKAVPTIKIGEGKYWCYDLKFGGEPFMTDVNTLEAAQNEVTRRILMGDDVPLNDAYELIGHEQVKMAEAFGWKYDDMHQSNNRADFGISTMLKDGIPVLTISPNVRIIDGGMFGIPDYEHFGG